MIAVARRRKPRSFVDFSSVPPSQWAIHDRLLNWARWSRAPLGRDNAPATPMFSLYRSSDAKRRDYGEEISVPVDKDDALRLHFAIVHPTFNPQCRRALQWSYLRPSNPSGAAHELGVELQELADLVRAGRVLLIERGV